MLYVKSVLWVGLGLFLVYFCIFSPTATEHFWSKLGEVKLEKRTCLWHNSHISESNMRVIVLSIIVLPSILCINSSNDIIVSNNVQEICFNESFSDIGNCIRNCKTTKRFNIRSNGISNGISNGRLNGLRLRGGSTSASDTSSKGKRQREVKNGTRLRQSKGKTKAARR